MKFYIRKTNPCPVGRQDGSAGGGHWGTGRQTDAATEREDCEEVKDL